MTINEITIPLGKLVPSKANVRRVNAEVRSGELAASLSAHGLIQNLVVRKAPKGDKYEVVAGGRRLGAYRHLQKEGGSVEGVAVTKDYPVRVIVRQTGNDTEISLAENAQREPMHPVDEVVAYRELVEQGMAVEDIAARFGQSVVTVRQRIKLGSLSPRILDVMREDAMTLEQARALAISDDHQAQEAAWFEQDSWNRNPNNLRAFLTSEHVRATDRIARFVGLDAYEAAGGAVVRDLFADDGLTFLTDRPLLVKLAGQQLEAVAAELRPQGWKWVEVSLDANIVHTGGFGRIHPSRRELTDAEEAEVSALGEQHDALNEGLEAYAEGDPQIEADEARLQELEQRIEAIQDAAATYDPREQALAGCMVAIAHGGTLQLTTGLVRPDDRKALAALHAGDVEAPTDDEGVAKDEAESGAKGLSASLVEELTAIRTAALRVELAGRPQVALAALLFPLVAQVFHGYHRGTVAAAVEVRGERRDLAVSIKEPDAAKALAGWQDILGQWGDRIPGAPTDLWPWLLAQRDDTLLDLLAVVTAANVNAVVARHDASKDRLAQADQIATAVGLDMNQWWKPEAAFLSRLSKADIAGVMREAGCSAEAANAVERAPKAEAVLEAEKELDGKGWLPTVLRPTMDAPVEEVPMAIAAE